MLQSPHSPSPLGRPPFPANLQGRPRPPNMTVAMPPPSPSGVYQPRPDGAPQNPQGIRGGPLYSRMPFTHQPPRQQMAPSIQGDVYGTPPQTPQPGDTVPQSPLPAQGRPFDPESGIGPPSVMQDQFNHNSPLQSQQPPSDQDGVTGRPSPSPQTPEAKQQLRGLLQRDQNRRLEQEQLPQQGEVPSQNRPPWVHPDDPSKLQGVVPTDGQQIVQRLSIPPGVPNKGIPGEFRQPLLPSHIRVPANIVQLSPGHPVAQRTNMDFRMGTPGMDPRARILLQHQQRGILVQSQQVLQQRPQASFSQFPAGSLPPQSPQIRNTLDPYDHLVVQQQQPRMPGIPVSTSPMLAQQLGRPLSTPASVAVAVSSPQLSPHHNIHSAAAAAAAAAAAQAHQQQPSPMLSSVVSTAPDNVPTSVSPATAASMADHQELPDSVTEELEKLEQEHNGDHGVEGEASELADLGMDDDELLGMGDDFNILEYADSELDEVVGGEKTNILDNLDLEEDEKDEGRKDESDIKDGDKKVPGITSADFASLTVKSSTVGITKVTDVLTNQPNVSHMLSSANTTYIHTSGAPLPHGAHPDGHLLRPTHQQQPPPPPYPGPPPPYPGRPQVI